MILSVEFERSTWKPSPHRLKPAHRTFPVSSASRAMDYLDKIGRDNIAHHDQELGLMPSRSFHISRRAFVCSARTLAARAW